MQTAFAFELRIVACTVCGAPLAVGSAGGRLQCEYCRSTQVAHAPARAVERAAPIAEPQRIAHLHQQDHSALEVPASVAPLFLGVELLPWKIGEALRAWQRAREEASIQHAIETETVLHRLTLALAKHFGDEGDSMRERSLLEGGLEAIRAPRFRQSIIGALTRAACRVGDGQAAEAWLGLCDPMPHELMADTAYRYARATVDTMFGRFERVIETLGPNVGHIPIDNEHEAACVLFRANAFEQQGNTNHAIELLDHFYANSSSFHRYLARLCQEQHAGWQLCTSSLPIAERRQRERGAKTIERASGSPKAGCLITLGVLVVGVGAAVPLAMFVGAGTAHFTLGLVGLIVVVAGMLTRVEWRKAARKRYLREYGVPSAARVIHARGTGVVSMGVSQLLYRVMVLPTEGTPFIAHSQFYADEREQQRFFPGALVIVRMDPQSRGDVHFELD